MSVKASEIEYDYVEKAVKETVSNLVWCLPSSGEVDFSNEIKQLATVYVLIMKANCTEEYDFTDEDRSRLKEMNEYVKNSKYDSTENKTAKTARASIEELLGKLMEHYGITSGDSVYDSEFNVITNEIIMKIRGIVASLKQ